MKFPKAYGASSVFQVEGLLRESRRQNAIPEGSVPPLCLLDPDGDFFRHLVATGASKNPYWACYHSEMFNYEQGGSEVGVVGCAVGAPYAVLVAEQLFASGCRLLVSVTSAGLVAEQPPPDSHILITRALRDEGTSDHYLAPASYAEISPAMLNVGRRIQHLGYPLVEGGVWTTDAPFRETEEAITLARSEGLLAVEMEAAALYALAQAKAYPILCMARVTNQMAVVGDDFEKGEERGNRDLMRLLEVLERAWKEEALEK